jgi:hypothetical protein
MKAEQSSQQRIGSNGPAAHAAADIRDRIAAKRAREALVPGRIPCPRCEGQKYDRGSCRVCDNRGWLAESQSGDSR